MANAWIFFIFSLIAVFTVVLTSDQSEDSMESLDKKSEEIIASKRPSFFVGSRYGRSYYGNSKNARVNVAPRNDRFFLGSRYGKRSNGYLSPLQWEQQDSSLVSSSSNRSKFFTMSCVHTGFKNFFRCNAVNDIDNFIHHLSNDEQ